MKLLSNVHSQIAEARKIHWKIMTRNEAEIKNLYYPVILQGVKNELELSKSDKKCDELQENHLNMSNILLELSRPNKIPENRLIQLQWIIAKLWNTIQFQIHYKNSG